MRKSGKIAYFVLDKLIIKDKPLDSVKKRNYARDTLEYDLTSVRCHGATCRNTFL